MSYECWAAMRLEKALDQIEHKAEHNLKKRFACSHCGKTWVEVVGILEICKNQYRPGFTKALTAYA